MRSSRLAYPAGVTTAAPADPQVITGAERTWKQDTSNVRNEPCDTPSILDILVTLQRNELKAMLTDGGECDGHGEEMCAAGRYLDEALAHSLHVIKAIAALKTSEAGAKSVFYFLAVDIYLTYFWK